MYWQNLFAKKASHKDYVALKQSLLHALKPNVPIQYLARVKLRSQLKSNRMQGGEPDPLKLAGSL